MHTETASRILPSTLHPLILSVGRGGINRLHSPIAQDGPRLEVGLAEVFEKILEPCMEDLLIESTLKMHGLLRLLDGSSCRTLEAVSVYIECPRPCARRP